MGLLFVYSQWKGNTHLWPSFLLNWEKNLPFRTGQVHFQVLELASSFPPLYRSPPTASEHYVVLRNASDEHASREKRPWALKALKQAEVAHYCPGNHSAPELQNSSTEHFGRRVSRLVSRLPHQSPCFIPTPRLFALACKQLDLCYRERKRGDTDSDAFIQWQRTAPQLAIVHRPKFIKLY